MKPDIMNASLFSFLYVTWESYAHIKVTPGQSEHQTAACEQPFGKQLYSLDIERERHVDNQRSRNSFVDDPQGFIQVLSSLPFDYFSLTKFW